MTDAVPGPDAAERAYSPDGMDELFSELSREPDLDAPELQAYDATDRLLLETAESSGFAQDDGNLVVIGDRHGALTLGAAVALAAREVRVFQDPLLSERALAANASRLGLNGRYRSHPLDASLLEGASLVLMQLPRSLAELDEIAEAIARFARPDVTVLAGGRVKHMTRSMNEVLGRSFSAVSAGLARRKSRLLTAREPYSVDRLGGPRFPVWGRDPELPFELAAFGATFGGAALDHGSRLLLRSLGDSPPVADPQRIVDRGTDALVADPQRIVDLGTDALVADPQRIVDLGCGNGVLAVSAALKWPEATVIASDQSAAAVAATRLTAEAAGVAHRVQVHRADGAEAVADGWADLVLLNPPFHSGSTVHTALAHRLIRSCRRALAPGGELRVVFNSRLGYRPVLERAIGPVKQLARDSSFTVISAVRGSEAALAVPEKRPSYRTPKKITKR